MTTPGGTPTASLDGLPLRELFGAAHGEDDTALGVTPLVTFADALRERQQSGWTTLRLVPDDTEWISTTLGAYEGASDWVEINVCVRSWKTESWRPPGETQRLWRVWLALEVACWCTPDHGIHPIHEVTFETGSCDGLDRACRAAIPVVDTWIAEGLLPADQWRDRAGLPLRETP